MKSEIKQKASDIAAALTVVIGSEVADKKIKKAVEKSAEKLAKEIAEIKKDAEKKEKKAVVSAILEFPFLLLFILLERIKMFDYGYVCDDLAILARNSTNLSSSTPLCTRNTNCNVRIFSNHLSV